MGCLNIFALVLWSVDFISIQRLGFDQSTDIPLIFKMAPLTDEYLKSNSDDFLVSGSSDSTSRIWSLKSLECLHVLEGHTDAVNCVAIKVLHIILALWVWIALRDSFLFRMTLLWLVVVTVLCEFMMYTLDSVTSTLKHLWFLAFIQSLIYSCRLLHGHSGSVDHIAFDGSTAISGGSDWYVCICTVKRYFMHVTNLSEFIKIGPLVYLCDFYLWHCILVLCVL